MRRGAPPVEHPGRRKQERSRTHRGDPTRALRRILDPANQRTVFDRFDRRGNAVPARHHQRVDPPAALRGRCRRRYCVAAAWSNDLIAFSGDYLNPVRARTEPGGAREHLSRAGDVKRLDPWVGEDDDSVSLHVTHDRRANLCPQ
jgi:hypothetical protein